MNYLTDNTRIIEKFDQITPNEVLDKYPLTDEVAALVYGTRNEISQILHGKDDRLLVICGPCSVHDKKSAIEYAKFLNLDLHVIDPRGYFASEKRFPHANIINLWPQEAFEHCPLDKKTALVALTHDPKIDDPAIQEALKKKCFYIGALGSKKTHENRCGRLLEAGFDSSDIDKIFGPIGIK